MFRALYSFLLTLALAAPVYSQGPAEEKALASLKKGAEFLLDMQNTDGSFGSKPTPAISALCAIALNNTPVDAEKRQKAVDRAMTYVLSYIKEDGSVRGKAGRHFVFFSDAGYPTYTTAVSLLAMATYEKTEYYEKIKAAREYLKTSQIEDKNSPHFGGYNYGAGGKADMSNTAWAAEALHITEKFDKEPFVKKGEKTKKNNTELWSALDEFLKQSQNLPDPKDNDTKGRDGGFAYRPGTVVSSGSMTYSGLKSMIYAKLQKEDPRVQGLLRYIRKNYSVDSNPGQGTKGYFYYIQAMSKALRVAKIKTIKTEDGQEHNWRNDIITKLCDMQTPNGAWFNTNGRYMESDLYLVTAYAMIAMQEAVKK